MKEKHSSSIKRGPMNEQGPIISQSPQNQDNLISSVSNSRVTPELARRESIQGLSDTEAKKRLAQYGENVLPTAKGPSALSILLSQFKSPLVYIILAAAIISFIVGERTDFSSSW